MLWTKQWVTEITLVHILRRPTVQRQPRAKMGEAGAEESRPRERKHRTPWESRMGPNSSWRLREGF